MYSPEDDLVFVDRKLGINTNQNIITKIGNHISSLLIDYLKRIITNSLKIINRNYKNSAQKII